MSIDKFGRYRTNLKKMSGGPPGVGFHLTSNGDYDIRLKRLCNVQVPKDALDAVNKEFVVSLIEKAVEEQNFTWQQKFDDMQRTINELPIKTDAIIIQENGNYKKVTKY